MRSEGCFSDSSEATPAASSFPISRARSCTCGVTSGVSVKPGHMQFTVTPPFLASLEDAYSSATTLESPISPCFDAT